MLYRLTLTLTKKQALLLFLVLCLPWVPDLNLNKSLEPPCKYFLHSKSSFNSLYSYTLNLLFLHIPECKLLITKFLALTQRKQEPTTPN